MCTGIISNRKKTIVGLVWQKIRVKGLVSGIIRRWIPDDCYLHDLEREAH